MSKATRLAEKEAFWRLVLEEFAKSGLTVRAYCRQEGLSKPSFYAWRRKLGAHHSTLSKRADALVPVQVIESGSSPASCEAPSRLLEIVTPAGFTLRFLAEIQRQHLSTLLSVVAEE